MMKIMKSIKVEKNVNKFAGIYKITKPWQVYLIRCMEGFIIHLWPIA